jgi:hypothetical protein
MTRQLRLFSGAALLVTALLAGGAAHAGGPLIASNTGRPYAWDTQRPLRYTVDPGPFGNFSNAEATRWVADAFRRWTSVEGVSLTVEATAPYSEDITGQNILEVLNALPAETNLIIFDHDGTVADTLWGFGESEKWAGRAGPRLVNLVRPIIGQGWAILNGRHRRGSAESWQAIFLHEIGHFLGLDHTQINAHVEYDGDATNDDLAPCMSYAAGPNERPSLHLDDRAWMAALYRKPGVASTTGTIRGRVLLPDGKTGLQGINVVARRDGDEEVTAVSVISGYLYKGWRYGSRDTEMQGFFELPNLPPGNYRLALEPLDEAPVVSPRHAFLPGGRRFWREGGPLATLPQEATLVAVGAGQVVAGRDFVLDGPSSPLREVAEVKPNYLPDLAQTVTLPAVVTGRVGPRDPHPWEVRVPYGSSDRVEVWHRVIVPEPTLLSARLTADTRTADLQLYLVSFLVSDANYSGTLTLLDHSTDLGTPPETFQKRVPPGVYYVGVSSVDSSRSPETDYRLTLLGVPAPDLPAAANPPRITLATVSDLTPTSMRVSWQTDQDANSHLYTGLPTREIASPALTRDHSFHVTGLSAGTDQMVSIVSRSESGELAELRRVPVRMPSTATGPAPSISAVLWGLMPADEKGDEFLIEVRVANRGDGPARNIRIEGMELPSGWGFAALPPLPLDLGEIGPESAAVVVVRVVRQGSAALPSVILQGSYATLDGNVRAFEP